MTKQLTLSRDLHLPINAVTQKLAFLGISGSGKTYAAGKFAELLLDAGAQVVVIDTIGNWWGLRLAADGKGEGISIPILGGERGDVPLESTAGNLVADTVADTRSSMIVDVSDFTGGELRRFVTDFATRLLKRKKQHKSPVMVIWEECQDVVPQFVRGEVASMVGAVEKLIKKGRNYGVGTVLISQRPQAVNKDVLNQVETLLAFRTGGAQERKAIHDWIVHQSIDVGDLVDTLPGLPNGTCYCWSPQWLKVLKKVAVGKKRTYDASATPEFGDEDKAHELTPVDIEKFKKTMTAAVEKAKAFDPALLRKRISELEHQLRAASAVQPAKVATKIVEKPILRDADIARLERAITKLAGCAVTKQIEKLDVIRDRMTQAQQVVSSEAHNLLTEIKRSRALPAPQLAPVVESGRVYPSGQAAFRKYKPAPQPANGHGETAPASEVKLRKGARKMLAVLATFREPLSRAQLGTLSGYALSGTFDAYVGDLKRAGLIETGDGDVTITPAGLAATSGHHLPRPQTTVELLDIWRPRLRKGARLMLDILVAAHPSAISRDDLATRSQYTESGTFDAYIGDLRRNGLATTGHGEVRASDALFLGGLT